MFANSSRGVERPRCGTGLQAPFLLSQKWRRVVKRREVNGRELPLPGLARSG